MSRTEQCIFCEIAGETEEEGRKVWENDLFFAMFDAFPVSPGHALVIPKRHVADFEGLTGEEWAGLRTAVSAVIALIEEANLEGVYREMLERELPPNAAWFIEQALEHPELKTKPDAYNHGINNGRAAGRTVDHLHWHVIPRYTGDMEDPRGGVRYVIPDMGNYKIPRE